MRELQQEQGSRLRQALLELRRLQLLHRAASAVAAESTEVGEAKTCRTASRHTGKSTAQREQRVHMRQSARWSGWQCSAASRVLMIARVHS